MICFPLDNTPYEAKDMGTYLATRTRGVFSSDGNLAVTPSESGLSVSVSPGLAWLKWSDYWGTAALQEQALTLDLDTADGALKRIDAIVCRLDKVNNRAEIVVKKGAPSSAPIVVPPVRDANYDELYIATVLIGAGVISISASAITDQRLNEEYCGLMRDGVTGIPTASLHAQAQQILTELTDALNAQIVRRVLQLILQLAQVAIQRLLHILPQESAKNDVVMAKRVAEHGEVAQHAHCRREHHGREDAGGQYQHAAQANRPIHCEDRVRKVAEHAGGQHAEQPGQQVTGAQEHERREHRLQAVAENPAPHRFIHRLHVESLRSQS